ncbi:hypothetical protein L6250_02265 [Candidatus Parcubacteria bacterium]|nr:hypothetical protein [Patescibacteria group bacterium]MBU4467035.1 hypothetical protein [Patescibacteria group bacterium]MCG2688440.1 hypothetical protein [Candidatus Parcubacteria bacterium]
MNVLVYAPPRTNQKFWLLTSLAFLIILASIFFWQNNQIIAKTYQLQHLQEKLTGLQEENQSLEASATKENSLSNLEELIKGLGLEKVQSISFIQAMEKSVVAR